MADCCYAECHLCCVQNRPILSAIMLNSIMLSVVAPYLGGAVTALSSFNLLNECKIDRIFGHYDSGYFGVNIS